MIMYNKNGRNWCFSRFLPFFLVLNRKNIKK
nr:MAG TPA_asm: hypothetical protein [Caudoviricetes sp.]